MNNRNFVSKRFNPYRLMYFQIFKERKELQALGVDVIDLGIGAPDLPTPDFIYDVLVEEARNQSTIVILLITEVSNFVKP